MAWIVFLPSLRVINVKSVKKGLRRILFGTDHIEYEPVILFQKLLGGANNVERSLLH